MTTERAVGSHAGAQPQVGAAAASARILNFNQDSGSFEAGERVTAEVEVRNTGSSDQTFFVGYSMVGPNGNWHDNDGQTGTTVTLSPNEREWVSVSWTVSNDVPVGEYDAVTSVWAESDRDNLQTRLDSARQNGAFEVVEPAEVDAAIRDVSVDGGTYDRGETVDATVVVENTGDESHAFFAGYSAVGPNGELYDNNGETGQVVTLDPGERRSVQVEWTVEDGVSSGEFGSRISVWAEQDRDNVRTRLDDVHRENVFTVTEPADISAQVVEASVASGEYTPGDAVDATAVIENTGNTEHTFFVGYSVIGPDSESYDNNEATGQTVTLQPGEQRTVSLEWTVQSTAVTGDYDARISVWKERDRDNLRTRLDDVRRADQFSVTEETEVAAEVVSVDIASGEFQSGSSVDATAIVENTGNTEHTFFVGYSALGPDGGVYDNDGQTGRTVTLAAGERRSVSLEWTVEDGTPAGSYGAEISVWAEQNRDNLQTRVDSVRRSSSFSVVESTAQSVKIVELDGASGEFQPDEEVMATAVVENTGNTEASFFVGYSVIGPEGDSYSNNDQTGTPITLGSGERRAITVEWTVPESVPSGEYYGRVSIWRETDRDNLQTRLDDAVQETAFEVVGESTSAMHVNAVDVDSGKYYEDGVVDASAVIENRGEEERTVYVSYGIPRGDSGADGVEITIGPGERRSIALSTEVSGSLSAGAYATRVAVWDSPAEQTLLTESVQSGVLTVVDSPAGSIEDMTFSSGDGEDSATVSVRLHNPTTTERSYELVPAEQSGVRIIAESPREVTLGAGELRTVSIPVSVNAEETQRTLELALAASDGTVLDSASVDASPAQTVLEVYAIDQDGDPISGVPVEPYVPDLERKATDETGLVKYTNLSGSSDALVFVENLRDRGFVTAKPTGSYTSTIEEGKRTRIIAEFERATTVTGTVTDSNGAAITDATIRVAGNGTEVPVGSNGNFELRRMESNDEYTIEVWQGADKLASIQREFVQGTQTVNFEIPDEELEGAASIRDRLSHAAANLFEDSTEAQKSQIFPENSAVVGSDPSVDRAETGPNYFMADDDTYRTSGPCAWYNSRETCKSYRMTTAEGIASSQGMVDGVSAGLQDSIEGLEALGEPVKSAKSMVNLVVTVMGDIGLLDDLIAQLPQQIQEQQRADNPHSKTHQPQQYEAYKHSWYAGYMTYLVMTSYLGTGITNYVKSSDRLADAADHLRDTSVPEVKQAVKFEASLRSGIGKAQYHVKTPGEVSARAWRDSIDQFRRNSNVPTSQLKRYLRNVKAARNTEAIQGSAGYFKDISEQGASKLTGTVLEAERAVDLANQQSVREVIVEPTDGGVFDLLVRKTDGETEYIEVKNRDPTKPALDTRKLRSELSGVQGQIRKSSVETSDGTSVATIGARKVSADLASRENLRQVLGQWLADSANPPRFDRVRIVAGSGTDRQVHTFDVEDFDITYPGAEHSRTPIQEPSIRSPQVASIAPVRSPGLG
ncbi:hypothetical protein [Halobacterium noricense]|uniref:hypothetical protein n=1 Tax=Halobacterium noricense TaxID=223182 RepID=UPI001E2C8CA9|nr:hypothetical protein [Halobacterium noricense]UHH26812.1 hypothetical protein LT974_07740 [Halobacterium noricense]